MPNTHVGLRFYGAPFTLADPDCLPHRASRRCFSLELGGKNNASHKALHGSHLSSMMGYANSNTGLCVSQSMGTGKENGKMTNIMAAKIVVTVVLGTAAALMLYGLWSIIDLWLIPMKPFKSVAEEKFMLRLMEEWAREGTLSVDRYTKREREYLKHLVEIGFVGVSEGSESGGDDEGNDSGQQGKDGH